MPENNYTPMPGISIDSAHIARVLSDTKEGCTYDTAIPLPGLNQITPSNNGNTSDFDGDGGTYATYTSPGKKDITYTLAGIEPKIRSAMRGAQYENGLLKSGANDKPPEWAFGYRREISGGSYKYVWLLKGKFVINEEAGQSKGNTSVTFQPTTGTFSSQNRIFDGNDLFSVEDNDPNLPTFITPEIIAEEWFKDPNAAFIQADGVGDGEGG